MALKQYFTWWWFSASQFSFLILWYYHLGLPPVIDTWIAICDRHLGLPPGITLSCCLVLSPLIFTVNVTLGLPPGIATWDSLLGLPLGDFNLGLSPWDFHMELSSGIDTFDCHLWFPHWIDTWDNQPSTLWYNSWPSVLKNIWFNQTRQLSLSLQPRLL